MRLIDECGRFFRAIAAQREARLPDTAIQTVIEGMQRLFGLTVADLSTLDVEGLYAQLVGGENEENAREKCIAFAGLNYQAGLAYAEKDMPALAQPAFHLALVFSLRALPSYPAGEIPPFAPDPGVLRHQLEGFGVPESTLELLAEYERRLKVRPS
ncbi:MAG TPA: hypothetical protein VFE25_07185 [Opitutaceae bacterium]|jgi:hypothetical protein|nr:hypothetical protein [Opitutaceae bacterium]